MKSILNKFKKQIFVFLILLAGAGALVLPEIISAGTCDYTETGWSVSCGFGVPTYSNDVTLPAASAAACASMCGCFSGKIERSGCSFTY